jgi:hypothetical protein
MTPQEGAGGAKKASAATAAAQGEQEVYRRVTAVCHHSFQIPRLRFGSSQGNTINLRNESGGKP